MKKDKKSARQMTQKECGGQIQIMRQKGKKEMGRSSAQGRKPQREKEKTQSN